MFPQGSSRLPFLGLSVRLLACLLFAFASAQAGAEESKPKFLDLSLLVADDHPCTWPAGFPPFQINHYLKIGPLTVSKTRRRDRSSKRPRARFSSRRFATPAAAITPSRSRSQV